MLKYKLDYVDFDSPLLLIKFVNENNITPRQIQAIISKSSLGYHRLFYWKRKE